MCTRKEPKRIQFLKCRCKGCHKSPVHIHNKFLSRSRLFSSFRTDLLANVYINIILMTCSSHDCSFFSFLFPPFFSILFLSIPISISLEHRLEYPRVPTKIFGADLEKKKKKKRNDQQNFHPSK